MARNPSSVCLLWPQAQKNLRGLLPRRSFGRQGEPSLPGETGDKLKKLIAIFIFFPRPSVLQVRSLICLTPVTPTSPAPTHAPNYPRSHLPPTLHTDAGRYW